MAKEKVVIQGQPVGRFKASWLLFKETFRFFWADSEMLLIPLVTLVLNLVLFGLLVLAFVFFVFNGNVEGIGNEDQTSLYEYFFIFLGYIIGAFTVALTQAGITHIVYTRIRGGDATLMQGLSVAFSHWFPLLVWSVITSTVGLFLRMVAERSKILGSIVAIFLSVAWSALTYFVVPAMVIDKHSAFGSIKKSGAVFKQTWGETLITNFSFGLIFIAAHVVAIFGFSGILILGVATEAPLLVILALVFLVFWVIIVSLVQASMGGVLKTLLYVYASENAVPENFNRELLEKMLSRKDGTMPNHDAVNPSQIQQAQENLQQHAPSPIVAPPSPPPAQ